MSNGISFFMASRLCEANLLYLLKNSESLGL